MLSGSINELQCHGALASARRHLYFNLCQILKKGKKKQKNRSDKEVSAFNKSKPHSAVHTQRQTAFTLRKKKNVFLFRRVRFKAEWSRLPAADLSAI